jgi:hypothetical protein
MKAHEILQSGIDAMADRAALRDQPTGERSMGRAVAIFRAVTGVESPRLECEADGWLFMLCLKLARSQQGRFCLDDWVDMAAYAALTGETLAANADCDAQEAAGSTKSGDPLPTAGVGRENGPDGDLERGGWSSLAALPPIGETVEILLRREPREPRETAVGWLDLYGRWHVREGAESRDLAESPVAWRWENGPGRSGIGWC